MRGLFALTADERVPADHFWNRLPKQRAQIEADPVKGRELNMRD
jgi:hypothetical protein